MSLEEKHWGALRGLTWVVCPRISWADPKAHQGTFPQPRIPSIWLMPKTLCPFTRVCFSWKLSLCNFSPQIPGVRFRATLNNTLLSSVPDSPSNSFLCQRVLVPSTSLCRSWFPDPSPPCWLSLRPWAGESLLSAASTNWSQNSSQGPMNPENAGIRNPSN